MKLVSACNEILHQLSDLVHSLTDEDFSRPSRALSNSTIGQHLRHTLEFFICFEQGCKTGVINYDKRNHDKSIETNRRLAAETIRRITGFVSNLEENRPLSLEVSYDLEKEKFESLHTTTARELVYNIEHAVHHMAIMKIGINEIAPYIKLPAGFGIAASTIRHKQTHAGVASN
jgi:uncharacterized damage-inducible protein DinB